MRKNKRSAQNASLVGVLHIGSEGVAVPVGYHQLTEAPEVAAAVWRISDMIASVPIRLMKNTENGDVRIRDALAKKVDVSPWSLGTRSDFISWIVSTMLLHGEAFVLPSTGIGGLLDLSPMPGARATEKENGRAYEIIWRNLAFEPSEILHFKLRPDLLKPWKGSGPRVQLQAVVDSIIQTAATKQAYLSSEYKPPLIVAVNSESSLADAESRSTFVQNFLKRKDPSEPLIIPADLMNISQAKPLSLNDLAIKDGIELDKKSVASLFGVPAFMVGAGSYSRDEYNSFVRSVLLPICKIIEQELTKKLLLAEDRYFKFNTLRLYAYDLQTLATIGNEEYVRGIMTGNEVRAWLELGPKDGLNELVMLENYIPADRLGDQKKLIQEGEPADE